MAGLEGDQLNEILATTQKHIEKKIPDLLSKSNLLLHKLEKSKKRITGGNTIQFPIQIANNKSQGFTNGEHAQLDTNRNQTITHGSIDWKYHYWTFTVNLREMTETQDTEQAVVDLIEAKQKIAERSVPKEFNQVLFDTSANNIQQFNGLKDMISTSAYAGIDIDPAEDGSNIWQAEVDTSTANPTFPNISKFLGTLKERASGPNQENAKVDIMISRQSIIDTFVTQQQLQERFVGTSSLAAGFDHVNVSGIPWVADEDCPGTSGGTDFYIYCLASDTIKLFYKYGFGNKSPMDESGMRVVNEAVTSKVGFTVGNFGCVNRRLNGVFTGMSEALS